MRHAHDPGRVPLRLLAPRAALPPGAGGAGRDSARDDDRNARGHGDPGLDPTRGAHGDSPFWDRAQALLDQGRRPSDEPAFLAAFAEAPAEDWEELLLLEGALARLAAAPPAPAAPLHAPPPTAPLARLRPALAAGLLVSLALATLGDLPPSLDGPTPLLGSAGPATSPVVTADALAHLSAAARGPRIERFSLSVSRGTPPTDEATPGHRAPLAMPAPTGIRQLVATRTRTTPDRP